MFSQHSSTGINTAQQNLTNVSNDDNDNEINKDYNNDDIHDNNNNDCCIIVNDRNAVARA